MAAQRARRLVPEKKPARKVRKSYLFPVVTLATAFLVGFSSFLPDSVLGTFAAEENHYSITIGSAPGSYTFVVTGDESTDITLAANEATQDLDAEHGVVTFTVNTAGETVFKVSSDSPIDSISFNEGADEVSCVDGTDSGLKSVDVSQCVNLASLILRDTQVNSLNVSGLTSLSYINLIHTPFATFENAYALETSNPEGCSISVNPPVYTAGEDCVEFDVAGLGEKSNLTIKLHDGTIVTPSGDKYSVPNEKLRQIYNDENNPDHLLFFIANNTAKPKNQYYFDMFAEDLPDASILQANSPASGNTGNEGGNTGNEGGNTGNEGDNTSNEGGNTGNEGGNTGNEGGNTGNEGGNTGNEGGNTGNEGGDEQTETPFAELTIDSGSKNIIKKAYIEKHDDIDHTKLKIVAKSLTSANRKSFLAAVKKADKDFNDSDPNLMVYDIYLVDSKGKQVSVKDKSAVMVELAYPSKEVSTLSSIFEYKVYHQLSDKSIDTSIEATSGENGIRFTTDSFSPFAISCTRAKQTYLDLVIADNSKKTIKAARAHENSSFSIEGGYEYSAEDIMISAAVPSEEEKKEFLAAIKKADKNFNEKDKNLMVYKINLSYIPQDLPAQLASGRVDFTLAYPNDTVGKNYGKFNYTVYHQKADKSVDLNQVAVGTADGVMITTNGFSLFAVSSTAKSSGNNPATGEASVSSNIALLLFLLSVVSFAGVYAKNKAARYSFDDDRRYAER